jgi:hypothetical protein
MQLLSKCTNLFFTQAETDTCLTNGNYIPGIRLAVGICNMFSIGRYSVTGNCISSSKAKKDTLQLENEIDQLVYKLYNLTPEEIKIIEDSIM